MPITDAQRISVQKTAPVSLMLWRALQPLRSIIRFMNTGAHPDDETSAMLAALTYRDGLSVAYACSTRGEGGQNNIGSEAGFDLGTLRTAEMERAADVLGLSMYWLSESPDDPITDFGFSKSGVETLSKWTHARTLRRMVEILRADRPDIICPTFLDIPGQHGHHRAMTEVAQQAILAAADGAFGADGAPWQVSKMYLPAWSGAGDAYDDDLPPPPETSRISGAGREPVSGWSWAEIGQQSRVFHATQGMGRWVGGAEGDGWPLHLLLSEVGPDRGGEITDGLSANFAAIVPGDTAFSDLDAALGETVAGFPDFDAVVRASLVALRALEIAQAARPADLAGILDHRLLCKRSELARVLRLAAGIRVEGFLACDTVTPGQSVAATLKLQVPHGRVRASASWALPTGWHEHDGTITVADDARPADPYPSVYHAHGPRGPVAIRLMIGAGDLEVSTMLPLETPVLVLPETEAFAEPKAVFLNTDAATPIALRMTAGATLDMPDGWSLTKAASEYLLTAPSKPKPGVHDIAVRVADKPARFVSRIDHPHTGPLIRATPAILRVRVARVALPEARVGYVGGGNDRIDHWLGAMGCTPQVMADADLSVDGIAQLDTLVVGIFAMKQRPALLNAMPQIHDWVRAGGNLVTLYHRPWDAWDPDVVPPLRLEIGKPSLRYRVTDETAAVRHLLPDHPLLTQPNRIGPEDWDGWVKERGLYFAKSWDDAYAPLLEMADPGEAPLRGALLSARIGAGRHTHCGLILHIQMENLVPGAFRLMANLIAKAGR